ncbi:MAG: hypothetical protein IT367_11380 [Candidatus Hydrogenedentes bacterium]|nr:hypothetical protein [Candidatus Hydrogenedentota bacterium]
MGTPPCAPGLTLDAPQVAAVTEVENEMVKGLVIRQGLTAINLLFALGIAYIVYLVVAQQFAGTPAEASPTSPPESKPLQIKSIGPRSDYDVIAKGRLFGEAGTVTAPPPLQEPDNKPIVETTANINLLATVASTPTDPLATAIIENPSATTPSKASTYYLGQMVTDSLKLIEVHRRRVFLLNTSTQQKETLTMAQMGSDATMAKGGPIAGRNAKVASAGGKDDDKNHVTLERTAVMEELNSYDYADLMAQLNPQIVEDEKGNVTGITSASLTSIPLAKQAGLQDNDVIQAVNGITIDSQEKIGEIAQKVGSANTIRLSVLREGKPQMITIKVQ